MLRGLQGLLARIYDAPAAHDVHDFLVTDALRAAELAGRAQPPSTDEQLLLAEGADGLELSLYVDAEVLRRRRRVVRCTRSTNATSPTTAPRSRA